MKVKIRSFGTKAKTFAHLAITVHFMNNVFFNG
jgi:hypothetical protein